MREHDIDDRGMGPDEDVDLAEISQGVCTECAGTGVTAEGDVCPTCDGTGRSIEDSPGA